MTATSGARTAALIRRLLAQVRASGTKAGHLAIKVTTESHGYCQYRNVGGYPVPHGRGFRIEGQTHIDYCGPACEAWRTVLEDAQDWLDEMAPEQLKTEHRTVERPRRAASVQLPLEMSA